MINLKNKITQKKFDNEFSRKLIDAEIIFNKIYNICGNEMTYGCGSYLISSKKYEYSINMYEKQKLLYDKTKNINSLLEIGTYMGHSLLIILLANPNIHVTCIDIDDKYSGKVTKYLQSVFLNSKIDFIKGNSLNILPKIEKKYDFFHIDGAHGNTIITQEFIHCKRLSSSNDFKLIFDDVEACKTLHTNINFSYQLIDSFSPNCDNKNKFIHIRIQSDLKENYKEDVRFKFNVIVSFIKEFPVRLTRYILRKIKKN